MGGFAESVEASREIASEPGTVAGNRARPIKRGRGPGHRTSRLALSLDQIGPRPGEAGLAGLEPGTADAVPGTAPGIDPRAWNCRRSFGDNRKSRSPSDAGKDGDHRPSWRSCAGRRMCGSFRRTKVEGMS